LVVLALSTLVCASAQAAPPSSQGRVSVVLAQDDGGREHPQVVVAVFGDSLADGLWEGLRLESRGGERSFLRLGTISKGLTRPDWRQWVRDGADRVRSSGASKVLIMLGANDLQGLRDGSRSAKAFASKEWDGVYGERVVEVVRAMTEAGADVEWVGLPVMRDKSMDDGARHIDSVVEATTRSLGIPWIRTSDLFRSKDGSYSVAPSRERLRADDGVHFTGTGYRNLARAAWARSEDGSTSR
jgi:hypothetical protein